MIMQWNLDKPHRCPSCHAIYIERQPSRFVIYRCCRCGVGITRWPWLAPILPDRGVVCEEHG